MKSLFTSVGFALLALLLIAAAPGDKSKGFPIDPTGQLPDGTAFKDFFGLRDAIATRTDVFTRGLTEALIEYALGRPFGFVDEDLADGLVRGSKNNAFQFRQIIQSLVASQAFHKK
jgi:Protein of unknown function (DUF1585)